MGGSWQNKPIEITPGVPKDVEGLRKSLMTLLSQKMSQGATPYGGPVAAGLDPLQVMAANIMSQQMYKRPYTGGKPINFQSGRSGSNLPAWNPIGGNYGWTPYGYGSDDLDPVTGGPQVPGGPDKGPSQPPIIPRDPIPDPDDPSTWPM